MSCASGKEAYPDLQTALVVRDALIQRYGKGKLAYKCFQSCRMWHLTTYPASGGLSNQMRRWNNLITLSQQTQYADMVSEASNRVADNLQVLHRSTSRR